MLLIIQIYFRVPLSHSARLIMSPSLVKDSSFATDFPELTFLAQLGVVGIFADDLQVYG